MQKVLFFYTKKLILFRNLFIELAKREKYLACELAGNRYEIAAKYGLFEAQLALAMEGSDKDEILTNILDYLATRKLQNDK